MEKEKKQQNELNVTRAKKNKSTFLKEIKPRKKMFQLQNMQIYCKNCKKHTGNTFPKKLVLISKNKIKGKSKCAIVWLRGLLLIKLKTNVI